jgi:CDP-diacylglycerol---glycerol-3-phosphate 3-phosphatidyltransferase
MAANNLPKEIQERGLKLLRPIVDPLIRRGVDPNYITTVGFLVTIAAGVAFFMGHPRIAGALVLSGGFFDIIDGEVARGGGRTTVFGSFYDATLDRFSEVVMFIGILSLYGGWHPDFDYPWMVYVVGLALGGSLMVSYTRARAEALGLDCNVGMMQRTERVVLIGLSALLFGGWLGGAVLTWVLLIITVLTNFTVFQRIVWVHRHTAEARSEPLPQAPRAAVKLPQKTGTRR